jgi:hypothetical protein
MSNRRDVGKLMKSSFSSLALLAGTRLLGFPTAISNEGSEGALSE